MSLFRRSAGDAERRDLSFQQVWGSGGDWLKTNGGSQEQALRLVPVFAAARYLSDGVSSLPLDEFVAVGARRRSAPLSPVFARTNDPGNTQVWIAKAVTSMALRGNAFALPTSYDARGHVSRAEWLHPDDVEIVDDTAPVPQWLVGGEPVDDLIHVPNFVVPGRHLGLSPIAAYKAVIETGLHAQDFGRDWFRNGATPSGVVSIDAPIDQDQAAVVKSRWRKSVRSREPVVLGKGWDYKAISVNADESQFLATIKATATQVAAIYGIRPERLGGESGSSMTYANVESGAIDEQQTALRPYMTKLEAALSALLPRPRFVRFNADAVLRMTTADRWSVHQAQLETHAMTINEVRALNDLPPVPWGDAPYEPTPAAPAMTEEPS